MPDYMLNLRSFIINKAKVSILSFLIVFNVVLAKAETKDSLGITSPTTVVDKSSGIYYSAVDIGGQINPSGYNSLLRLSTLAGIHKFGFGLSYNLSDGYLNAPVLGPEIHYGVIVSEGSYHFIDLGLQYQRQRVTKELASTQLHLRSAINLIFSDRWVASLDMGVGMFRYKVKTDDIKTIQTTKSAHFGLSCAYAFLL